MSEETSKAKSAVPPAIFWSIFANGVLTLVMVAMILSAMASIEDAANPASLITTILLHITGSRAAATALMSGLLFIPFSRNLTNIASGSRLIWAWASDGGLPRYFAYVHPKYRVSPPVGRAGHIRRLGALPPEHRQRKRFVSNDAISVCL
ncbi:hypothetical protein DL769_008430 [Monosporascus sp. CRB-8-3]|nr:hypothetical protein DL769_008430 [Monosporascus sp. CRB-8-3]